MPIIKRAWGKKGQAADHTIKKKKSRPRNSSKEKGGQRKLGRKKFIQRHPGELKAQIPNMVKREKRTLGTEKGPGKKKKKAHSLAKNSGKY